MWGDFILAEGKLYELQLGAFLCKIRRISDELHYMVDDEVLDFKVSPLHSIRWKKEYDEIGWKRCVVYENETKFRISPALPDKPVLVRTLTMVKIPGYKDTLFYIQIPVWIRCEVLTRSGSNVVLTDLSSEKLSKSWFGDPVNGEPCYALRTHAVRSLEELIAEPHLITCPLTIRNGIDPPLSFERINLHVEFMSVFEGEAQLWTNSAGVVFRGIDQVSQISFSNSPPPAAGNAVKRTDARQKMSHSLMRKSFLFLKKLTGIDQE